MSPATSAPGHKQFIQGTDPQAGPVWLQTVRFSGSKAKVLSMCSKHRSLSSHVDVQPRLYHGFIEGKRLGCAVCFRVLSESPWLCPARGTGEPSCTLS